ncbi:DUF4142 domain-containing protein [Paraburkholderia tagetis]|uniref:DUF4142 domain-containing protein n=1 Tax=Paraburkholderia tagetis TaxID=2913261 RepID=A0A9X1RWZ9_9BURK|nr:DUF4142 domain-containing protein [Paraburkholderia tagetis]MCG5076053.1 DUF4142 domain-containing protein [Paraburkholderia tagetis]
MKFALAAIACVLACGTPLCAQAQQTEAASTTAANPLPATDRAFVQTASMSSSTEIDAAKLAMHNTENKDVHAFARHMALDHTKLSAQLKIAAPQGVAVPVKNSDEAVLNSLRSLKGAAFDKAYVQKMGLQGHKDALQAFHKEAADGQNDNLKKAAQKALPTIEQHYRMAQALAQKVGEDMAAAR